MGRLTDITGQKFNMLTAIKYDHSAQNSQFWLFKCDCGQEKVIRKENVLGGRAKSCGCFKKSGCAKRDDITDQKFGLLTAIKYDHTDSNRQTYWLFKCDCGCEKVIQKAHVLDGHTQSCGCVQSSMEVRIKNLLNSRQISYEEQKSFDECRDKIPLRFDFYIPDMNLLIEAQGEQHYRAFDYFGGRKKFENQHRKDQIKRDFCSDNGIKLLEIRYDDDLESIIEKEVFLPAGMMSNKKE